MKLSASFLALVCLFISSGHVEIINACTFYVTNKCPFPIWPATAANTGHPVLAGGGFHLPRGKTQKFQAPDDWSGRIWARTGCVFDSSQQPACETGDCDGKLECAGSIGLPPATLVEFTLLADKRRPSFYDVSLVDGYNLPVAVATKPSVAKCGIKGCAGDLKAVCPTELAVRNRSGVVVACKSGCLAFNTDEYCCRNEYGTPAKCRPNKYSKIFKKACPAYFSYPFDTPSPLVNCPSDEYVLTFCPNGFGGGGDVAAE